MKYKKIGQTYLLSGFYFIDLIVTIIYSNIIAIFSQNKYSLNENTPITTYIFKKKRDMLGK